MLYIADRESFVNGNIKSVKLSYENKEKVLFVMNNAKCTFVAAQNVYDEIAKSTTDILLKAYEKDGFVWDDNDVYYFKTYDMPITDEFFKYCVSGENA